MDRYWPRWSQKLFLLHPHVGMIMTKRTSLLLTRRKTITAIFLGSGSLVLPRMALAAENAETILSARLAALRLPFAPARLDLMQVTHQQQAGLHQIRALIRLTWAPGMRQHYFSAQDSDLEAAASELVMQLYRSVCAATFPAVRTATAHALEGPILS